MRRVSTTKEMKSCMQKLIGTLFSKKQAGRKNQILTKRISQRVQKTKFHNSLMMNSLQNVFKDLQCHFLYRQSHHYK